MAAPMAVKMAGKMTRLKAAKLVLYRAKWMVLQWGVTTAEEWIY